MSDLIGGCDTETPFLFFLFPISLFVSILYVLYAGTSQAVQLQLDFHQVEHFKFYCILPHSNVHLNTRERVLIGPEPI